MGFEVVSSRFQKRLFYADPDPSCKSRMYHLQRHLVQNHLPELKDLGGRSRPCEGRSEAARRATSMNEGLLAPADGHLRGLDLARRHAPCSRTPQARGSARGGGAPGAVRGGRSRPQAAWRAPRGVQRGAWRREPGRCSPAQDPILKTEALGGEFPRGHLGNGR